MAINRVKLEDVINQAKEVLEGGNPDYVIVLCRYIFKYYPRALEVTRVLGEAYTEKKLLDEADQLFVYVLAADPHDVLGYVDRGFIAYERGNVDEAILYYERAIELDPNIEQLRTELLRLYKERFGSSRAKVRLTKAGLANYRLRDGFYNQAIDEYNNILQETPERLDIQVWLMEAYWRNRDYGRAEKLAHELLESHPYLIKANLILWHIYGVRRNQDRAAEYLEKAHALDPLNLVAERLFENALVADNAMSYISMLGVAALPAFDPETMEQENQDEPLLPVWITSDAETDRRLGLKGEEQGARAEARNSGPDVTQEEDWIAKLLAETEQQAGNTSATATPPTETAQEPAEEKEDAQADLEQLRQSQGDEAFGDLFEGFEEKPPEVNLTSSAAPKAEDKPQSGKADSFDDFFDEIAAPFSIESDSTLYPAKFNDDITNRGFKSQDFGEEVEPFNLETASNEVVAKPFAFELDEEPEPFSLESATAPEQAPGFKFDFDDEPEPFNLNAISPEQNSAEINYELFEFGRTEGSAIRPDKMLGADKTEAPPPPFNIADFDLGTPAEPETHQSETISTPKDQPSVSAEQAQPSSNYGWGDGPGVTGELNDFFDTDSPFEVDLFAPTMPPKDFGTEEEVVSDEEAVRFGANEGVTVKPFSFESGTEETEAGQPFLLELQNEFENDEAISNSFSFDVGQEAAKVTQPNTFEPDEKPFAFDDIPANAYEEISQPFVFELEEESGVDKQADKPFSFDYEEAVGGAVVQPFSFETDFKPQTDQPFSFGAEAEEQTPEEISQPFSFDMESLGLEKIGQDAEGLSSANSLDLEALQEGEKSYLSRYFEEEEVSSRPFSFEARKEPQELEPLPFSLDFDKEEATGQPLQFNFEEETEGGVSKPFSLEDEQETDEVVGKPFSFEEERETKPFSFEAESEAQLDEGAIVKPFSFDIESKTRTEAGEGATAKPFSFEAESEAQTESEHGAVAKPFSFEAESEAETEPDEGAIAKLSSFEVEGEAEPQVENKAEEATAKDVAGEDETEKHGMIATGLEKVAALAGEVAEAIGLSKLFGHKKDENEGEKDEGATEVRAEDDQTGRRLEEQDDNSYVNYLLESEAEPVEDKEAQTKINSEEATVLEPAIMSSPAIFEREVAEAQRLEAHAFHRRDERGPLPEAVARTSQSEDKLTTGVVGEEPNQATTLADAQDPAEAMRTEAAIAPFDQEEANTGPGVERSDKENEPMPIRKGSQDDDNVFDWEKEELPDYLKDFALDEDEVVQNRRPANPPIGSDMTTGPARIRPRDPEPARPGDFPDWLNPANNRQPQINMPGADAQDMGGARPSSGGGSLPGWFDAGSAPGQSNQAGGMPGMDDLGLDDLRPFSLDGEDGFGGPSLQPPSLPNVPQPRPQSQPQSFQPPAPSAGSAPSPFSLDDDFGDLAPFSMDDAAGRPLPPPSQRPAPQPQPRPQPQSFQPPAPPAGSSPFGLGNDLDDISPFNPLDFGEAPTAPTPPPPTQRQQPPAPQFPPQQPQAKPQSFQPPSAPFGGGDFDDLQPFSLEDAAGAPLPPPGQQPPRQQPPAPPPAQRQQPSMPQFQPQSGGPSPFGLGDDLDDIAPFNPFGESPATPPPSARQRPSEPVMPPMPQLGGEGFVQAGPGSLKPFNFDDFGSEAPASPPPASNARAGQENSIFQTDLSDDDIEPFSVGMDIPGLNEPTSFRADVDNLPDQPFYPQPKPRKPLSEPEFDAEPGQEKPLQKFGWLKDRKRREQEEEEEAGTAKGKSLFEKLAERRKQQAPASQDAELPVDFGPTEADRFDDYVPLDEIERQVGLGEVGAVQAPGTPPSIEPFSFDFDPTAPVGSQATAAEEPFSFDPTNLGATGPEAEADEPFSFDFQSTKPETTPFNFELEEAEARPFSFELEEQEVAKPFSFELEEAQAAPFNFELEESASAKPEPSLVEPFSFDLETFRPTEQEQAQAAPPAHPEPAFDFDFGGAEHIAETSTPEPAGFNFELDTAEAETASPAPAAFDFDLDAAPPAAQPFSFEMERNEVGKKPERMPLPDFDFSATTPPPPPVEHSFNFDLGELASVPPPPPPPPTKQPISDAWAIQTPPPPPPVRGTQESRPNLPDFDIERAAPPPPPPPPFRVEETQPRVESVRQPAVATNGSANDLASYQNRVKQNPRDLEANLHLGNSYYEQSKYSEAITHYNTAIKVADAETLKGIVARLEKITASEDTNTRFHRVLGDAYMKQGQYHWALSEYNKALGPAAKR